LWGENGDEMRFKGKGDVRSGEKAKKKSMKKTVGTGLGKRSCRNREKSCTESMQTGEKKKNIGGKGRREQGSKDAVAKDVTKKGGTPVGRITKRFWGQRGLVKLTRGGPEFHGQARRFKKNGGRKNRNGYRERERGGGGKKT